MVHLIQSKLWAIDNPRHKRLVNGHCLNPDVVCVRCSAEFIPGSIWKVQAIHIPIVFYTGQGSGTAIQYKYYEKT